MSNWIAVNVIRILSGFAIGHSGGGASRARVSELRSDADTATGVVEFE
jgi:hypothetical protein